MLSKPGQVPRFRLKSLRGKVGRRIQIQIATTNLPKLSDQNCKEEILGDAQLTLERSQRQKLGEVRAELEIDQCT